MNEFDGRVENWTLDSGCENTDRVYKRDFKNKDEFCSVNIEFFSVIIELYFNSILKIVIKMNNFNSFITFIFNPIFYLSF
jgi:hypothetical protein